MFQSLESTNAVKVTLKLFNKDVGAMEYILREPMELKEVKITIDGYSYESPL